MMKQILLLLFLLLVTSCNTKVTDKTDVQLSQEVIDTKKACDKGECPCDTPLGNISHGSKVTTYSKDRVSCEQGCGKLSEELTCNNGKFNKPIDGKHFKCTVDECPSCTLGSNLILSGETINAYSKGSVECNESCDDFKLRRTCTSGALSGAENYQFTSCSRKACRCTLPDNSGFLSLGGDIKLYSTQQATCGQTCLGNSQTRTCQSQGGTPEIFALDGLTQFQHRSCLEATNCFCTLPNGLGVIAHGQTRNVSSVSSVACGISCSAQPNINVLCDNGLFRSVANLNTIVDFSQPTYSTFQFQCVPQTCSFCPVPGTATLVPHGQTYHFAKSLTTGCGLACEYLDRLCQNGIFTGDTAYSADHCTPRSCICSVPGSGNQVPVGSSYSFYNVNSAVCGQTCVQHSQQRPCTEVENPPGTYQYVFGGNTSYSHSTCNEASGCSCALPNSLGQIDDGNTIVLVSQSPIACGTTCAQVPSIELRCSNGNLVRHADDTVVNTSDPSFPYQYLCAQSNCSDCNIPGYGSIPSNNITRTLYSKDIMTCSDQPDLLTYQFRCENAVLFRNGNVYNPLTDPNAPAHYYDSYTVNCPGCPLPWGGQVIIGQSVNAYKHFGTVVNGCGRGCRVSQRTCLANGTLTGDASYNLQNCDNNCNLEGGGAPPRACLLRWQNSFVTPDSQIPMWKKKIVGCGDSCQNHFQLSRCKMERGTFDAPFEYLYQTCTEVCP